MGRKIVCDRCGAEIKEQPSFLNIKLPIVIANVSVKETLWGDFYGFDLCDKCKVDLVDWIRKGRIKTNEDGSLNIIECAERKDGV